MGIFIAVILLLVALNGFFAFILNALIARVGKFAQNNALRQSSVFDELVVHKEDRLFDLMAQIEAAEARLAQDEGEAAAQQAQAPQQESFATPAADYVDQDFPQEYREIRENFVFDKDRVLRGVLARIPEGQGAADVAAARRILEEIDGDAAYELATLSAEDQLGVLAEAFDDAQRRLLDAYAQGRRRFDSPEFFAWLRRFVFEHGDEVLVRTGDKAEDFGGADKRVRTEYDEALCEGMYVISQGKLYDFSIRNKEITS